MTTDLPGPPEPNKTSGLAIIAFVISLLVFLPLVPLIGAILGIIATVKARPGQKGRGLAIAAIPVGFVTVFFLQGMIAAVAIPVFIAHTRKAKTSEATQSLTRLRTGAEAHALAAAQQEAVLDPFPRATTDWAPRIPCCKQATTPTCHSTIDDWRGTPWREFDFALGGPHYYQYRYRSDGKQLTIEARGDLDCDGTYSSFKLTGQHDGKKIDFSGPEISNALE